MKAKDNPFRVEQLHQLRFRFQSDNWESLLSHLKQSKFRGAIVGPHGSGKTTLLLELVEQLNELRLSTHSLRLNQETNKNSSFHVTNWLKTASFDQILILDGAEQLGWIAWRSLKRQSQQFAGLIITTHREGRLPTLLKTSTNPSLLQNIIEELVPDAEISFEEIKQLFSTHKGNLRDCLLSLYHQRQSQSD